MQAVIDHQNDWNNLLASRPLKDLIKQVKKVHEPHELTDLYNLCLSLTRRNGVGDWRHGHLSRHDLDKVALAAERRSDHLRKQRTQAARERERPLVAPIPSDPLAALNPKAKERSTHEQEQTRQGPQGRRKRRRRID